jgi:hypothetical protein
MDTKTTVNAAGIGDARIVNAAIFDVPTFDIMPYILRSPKS